MDESWLAVEAPEADRRTTSLTKALLGCCRNFGCIGTVIVPGTYVNRSRSLDVFVVSDEEPAERADIFTAPTQYLHLRRETPADGAAGLGSGRSQMFCVMLFGTIVYANMTAESWICRLRC